MFKRILLNCFFLGLAACAQDEATGPGEIRWDREVCARCSMAVSDRNFAAQVRGASAGEKTGLYKFDDIGCAVIWLEKQPWKDDERTELWVADHRNGAWLDARKAFFIKGRITPMNYGLGAQAESSEGALDYTKAKAHIMMAESEHHQHGGHQPMSHE